MPKLLSVVAAAALLNITVPASAQSDCFLFIQDFNGSATRDGFGERVSISGSTVAVAAPFHHITAHPAAPGEGAAFVYVRSGSQWVQQARLAADQPQIGGQFGISVAVDGDTIATGNTLAQAPGGPPGAGCVYIFDRAGGTWTRTVRIFSPQPVFNGGFGNILALSGDMLAVGTPLLDVPGIGTSTGSVFTYKRVGGSWVFQEQFAGPEAHASDRFGRSIAMSADTLVVAADIGRYSATPLAGAVYVYTRSGETWSFQAKLTHDAPADIGFGWTVALSGDTIFVGATKYPELSARVGAVYVFTRDGSNWTRSQLLTASDGEPNDRFGTSLALDGDTALIGATSNDSGVTDEGQAYLFTRAAGVWTEQLKLRSPQPASDDTFGGAVALDGSTVVVGDRLADRGGVTDAGAVSVFELTTCCTADLTGDGLVDFSDYLEFLNLYEALDPRVDFNGDGFIDFADYLEFLNLFDAGC